VNKGVQTSLDSPIACIVKSHPVLALFKDLANIPIRLHYAEIIIFVPIFNGNDAI